MKKQITTASLLAGFSMISGAAFAQVGTVGASVTRNASEFDDSDLTGLNGSVAIPTGGNFSVLLDGAYTASEGVNEGLLTSSAHLISRDSKGAWGGFAGLGNIDGSTADAAIGIVGGEYAAFFDSSTFVVALSYATVDDVNIDVLGLSSEYRLFVSDDLRFDIGGSFANLAFSGGDADVFNAGVGVEYRFSGTPFSIGANASYFEMDGFDGGKVNFVGATLRFDFGNDSLKARDRTGATFDSFGGMHRILQVIEAS